MEAHLGASWQTSFLVAGRVTWLPCFFLLTRVVSEEKSLMFIRPKKYIVSSGSEPPELGYVDIRTLADSVCRYDLNDMDAAWLELTNEEFKEMGERRGLCCLAADDERRVCEARGSGARLLTAGDASSVSASVRSRDHGLFVGDARVLLRQVC